MSVAEKAAVTFVFSAVKSSTSTWVMMFEKFADDSVMLPLLAAKLTVSVPIPPLIEPEPRKVESMIMLSLPSPPTSVSPVFPVSVSLPALPAR